MAEQRICRTAELEIAYEISGPEDGRPIVLLHGWPDDVRCWDKVIAALDYSAFRFHVPYLRGSGPTRFLRDETKRSGAIAALTLDLAQMLDALDLRDVLLVGYDWGARAAYGVAALFPQRVSAMVVASAGYATAIAAKDMPYDLARAYWYEWYTGMEIGRQAYRDDRVRLSRYLWESWSPDWPGKQEEFAEIVPSLGNPDWAEISIHAYQQRWHGAPGAPDHATAEQQLAQAPVIGVPTIMLQGAEDRDNMPGTSEGKERYFSARYERRLLEGVGHFVPREAPAAVAEAMRDLFGGTASPSLTAHGPQSLPSPK